MMNVCTVPNCGSPRRGRGFCNKHYLRWKFHGDPNVGRDLRKAGEGTVRNDGYISHGTAQGNKLGHVLAAEKALGKPLPPGAQVHHWDKNRANNEGTNLVICPDQAYHRLIHRRMDAFAACGNPNWMPCRFCSRYDDPAAMYVTASGADAYHRSCSAAYARQRRLQRNQLAAEKSAA